MYVEIENCVEVQQHNELSGRAHHVLQLDVSQVSPSYSPSPVVAQEGCTYQLRSRIRVSPNFS